LATTGANSPILHCPQGWAALGEGSPPSVGQVRMTLARLARIDPELLGPVRHRSAKAQIHLTVIRARAELVRARTALVNAARGLVKSYGQRLPKCGTQQVSRELGTGLHAELREALEPLLQEVESLNERIQEYEVRMEKIAKESYPHVELLKQVKGVGTQIALTYVLTLDDPHRFPKSREVGCFLGLCPGRRDSVESQPQMNISKEGDRYLRTMLVQGAHYILGPFGEDSDLRRWGLKLAARGGKSAKKRAVVAVARKLAVLLHRLWVVGRCMNHCAIARKRCAPWPKVKNSSQKRGCWGSTEFAIVVPKRSWCENFSVEK